MSKLWRNNCNDMKYFYLGATIWFWRRGFYSERIILSIGAAGKLIFIFVYQGQNIYFHSQQNFEKAKKKFKSINKKQSRGGFRMLVLERRQDRIFHVIYYIFVDYRYMHVYIVYMLAAISKIRH